MSAQKTIINARWLIPIEPRGAVLENQSIVIKDGQILDICPCKLALERYSDAEIIDRPNHVLMPGFINAHTHSAMSLFRGLADDLSLNEWLNDRIWPAEEKWADAQFIEDGTRLAIAEMLLSGTTNFSDMYFFPNVTAQICQEAGIRATVGLPILDFASSWASGPSEYFAKARTTHEEINSLPLINTSFAPHAPYTVSDEPLMETKSKARAMGVPIHMHVHETAQEIIDAVAQYGNRPIERLNKLELLDEHFIAVHMTQLIDEEINMLAKQKVNVVHCPISNAKLASGRCRVHDLLEADVNVALGTDGAASNNNLDMFIEMRTAALLGKLEANDAKALPAWQILEMATINGAKALNQENQTGSIVTGKAADLIAIDLSSVTTQPVYNPISQIVYSASREQLSDVWVNGNQVVSNKQLCSIDLLSLKETTIEWKNKIYSTAND